MKLALGLCEPARRCEAPLRVGVLGCGWQEGRDASLFIVAMSICSVADADRIFPPVFDEFSPII
jgi:hypothetical protein